jgi:hypothetical protein
MRSFAFALAGLLALPVCCLAEDAPVPRRIDTDGPSQGVVPLELRELWRAGGDDESVLFGRIADVKRHADGTVYVLDNQLCRIVVFSQDGEHLRDLSREGDGPGELRQPTGLVFLSDDTLGVGLGFPGKLVTLGIDGTPGPSLYPIGEPADGNIGVLISLQYVDGVMGATGARIAFQAEEGSHNKRFLAIGDGDLSGFRHILARDTPLDPSGHVFVETDDDYIDGSWALGSGGLVYAPMTRDAYEISVFDRHGELQRVFGRRAEPRKRTRHEMDQVGPVINFAGDAFRESWDIADHDRFVTRILVDPVDGTVWVLTPQGAADQPEGILQTWDVFAGDGEYLRSVPIPLGDAMNEGTLYLVGGGRLIMVRGTALGSYGDGADEDAEIEPLEVICYEVR